MPVPQVAIVGRPNVGKSSLFNWLAGKRIAITDAQAGITRDRVTFFLHEGERYFELVDTGGLGFEDPDQLSEQVEEQIRFAMEQAALVLFVVDTQEGIMPLDEEVIARLRQLEQPLILVANKTDSEKYDAAADEFYRFGVSPLVKVSVKAGRGKSELMEALLEHLPPAPDETAEAEPEMKLAIVGRRNVGKSTFINTLAQTERMIVSEVPGTTRDSVDVRFELDGKSFIAIDTPGVRKQKSMKENVEYYGLHRAQRSIRRADVVFLFFDAAEEIGRVEKQLAQYIFDQHKPCVFVVNKWDLYAGDVATGQWADYLDAEFPSQWYVPVSFVTGQTGRNVKKLVNLGQNLFKQARARIPTADLNRLITAAVERTPPPLAKGTHKRPKIFYATQVGVQPPTIVLFCNQPDAFEATYRRYLLSVLHDQLEYGEVPIKLHFRQRTRSEPGGKGPVEVEVGEDDGGAE